MDNSEGQPPLSSPNTAATHAGCFGSHHEPCLSYTLCNILSAVVLSGPWKRKKAPAARLPTAAQMPPNLLCVHPGEAVFPSSTCLPENLTVSAPQPVQWRQALLLSLPCTSGGPCGPTH